MACHLQSEGLVKHPGLVHWRNPLILLSDCASDWSPTDGEEEM